MVFDCWLQRCMRNTLFLNLSMSLMIDNKDDDGNLALVCPQKLKWNYMVRFSVAGTCHFYFSFFAALCLIRVMLSRWLYTTIGLIFRVTCHSHWLMNNMRGWEHRQCCIIYIDKPSHNAFYLDGNSEGEFL